ncbi:DNA-processing protein DprA [Rossellomorea aquimaris]|uniref:DNA-processing protein DprA n=1 Tax=Rossellomorea aquimaris TaxID=189382 RepID=UPI001CD543A9|nr:DNA-processing protein DprA [Rossellomorea aquimaris]MCA1053499.1 DNA-processing protein DprA [Rossellomorea aquimaris]
MKELSRLLFTMQHCRGLGLKGTKLLLSRVSSPSAIYRLSPASLQQLSQTTSENSRLFHKDLHTLPFQEYEEYYRRNNIHWLSVYDKGYPELLKHVYDPPLVLFLKGKKELLQSKRKLAVVGSRQATSYSEEILEGFMPALSARDITIVSGLAKGADTMAHKLAIKSRGSTIGVIAGGFNHIYPRENKELAEYMMENHLLISEYPPFSKPQKWQFPFRNRIISGLSHAVLITEAEKKSGTFITADYALNEGREILCIPGSVNHKFSEGTNLLIKEGAKMVLSIEDIFSELHV